MPLPSSEQLNRSEENRIMEELRALKKQVAELQRRPAAQTNFANAATTNVIVGTGDPFDINNPFTGTAILFPAYPDVSGEYHIFGMSAGVIQWGANSTDGKIYFGGGDGWLDEFGLFFANQQGVVSFLDTTGNDQTIEIFSDGGDYLILKNSFGGKGIKFEIDDAAHNVTQYVFTDADVAINNLSIKTGWWSVSETWTRTGNHTFTVSGDLTLKYRKGAKVHYDDGGGSEFGVVGSSSHAAGTTTVNLIPNTDYLMAAATITTTLISYIQNPESFPHWFNWAAAPTGFSTVPSSPVYKWSVYGQMIVLVYDEPNNGVSNATTFTASAPIVAIADANAVLGTTVDNSVVLTTPGRAVLLATSSTITFRRDTANSAWTAALGKRAVATLVYAF